MKRSQYLMHVLELVLGDNFKSANGYVSVKPDLSSTITIQEIINKLQIDGTMPSNKFHVTLMFSRKSTINANAEADRVYDATITGKVMPLGDYLVLELDSPALQNRYRELLDSEGISDYPSYIPHLSIKKNPTEEDILKASTAQIGSHVIKLTNESMVVPKD